MCGMTMKLGVLQCDHVLDKFLAAHGTYPQMFSSIFERIGFDVDIVTYDIVNGEFPENVNECDAFITTGSRFGVNDSLPWIDPLMAFVVALKQANKKMVGICFGHQLIAKALGGRVELSPKGWGVGVSFNQVQVRKEWMQPYCDALDLVVSHQDQVVTLPEGAQVLVASDFCPYYMVQYGDSFLGVQGHPEFTKSYSASLMYERRDRIPPQRIREGMTSLQSSVDAERCVSWIYKFLSYGSG